MISRAVTSSHWQTEVHRRRPRRSLAPNQAGRRRCRTRACRAAIPFQVIRWQCRVKWQPLLRTDLSLRPCNGGIQGLPGPDPPRNRRRRRATPTTSAALRRAPAHARHARQHSPSGSQARRAIRSPAPCDAKQHGIAIDRLFCALRCCGRNDDRPYTIDASDGAANDMAAQHGIPASSRSKEAGPIGADATSTKAAISIPASRNDRAVDQRLSRGAKPHGHASRTRDAKTFDQSTVAPVMPRTPGRSQPGNASPMLLGLPPRSRALSPSMTHRLPSWSCRPATGTGRSQPTLGPLA